MKKALLALLLVSSPVLAVGNCAITGSGHMTDMRESACFPQLDEAKCPYYINVPMVKMAGASQADVNDTKKYGLRIMNYANSQVCEGKTNCGFYVMEFATAANCDGKVIQDMPGGEYRGLSSAAARNIQMRANRELEAASKDGKARGDKTKNPKDRGKFWGADE